MPNDLSALEPIMYSAAREVAMEPFGAVGSIRTDFDDKGVAIGDKVKVPIAPVRSPADYVPANVSPSGAVATATSIEVSITKNRYVDWVLSGEQIRSLENGTVNTEWVRQLMAQGMRSLRNEVEADCCAALQSGASFLVGAGGTTPFASDLNVLARGRQALLDRGAPLSDMHCIMNSAAGVKLRQLNVFIQADQAGGADERRTGRMLPQFGFNLKESAGIGSHTKGAGTGYDLNADEPAGETSIVLDGGTVNTTGIKAGDSVSFAGSDEQYLVETGLTDVAGTMVLRGPGLLSAVGTGVEMTIGNSYTANLLLERNACVGIIRPPLIPESPIMQRMLVPDPSGLTYLFLEIVQDGQITWRLHLAWGFKVVNPHLVGILAG